jgi:DNA-binding IclR family transcriptional regulator
MSLANAAEVLHWLKRDRRDTGVADLSIAKGWPKSTTSRLLKDMAAFGLLERDIETLRYRPGLLMLELGRAYGAGDPILEAADEGLQEITRRTGHSTGVSILDGIDVVVLRSRPGTHPLRVVTPPGTRGPAWANSTGRVLLARLDDGDVARRFTPFPPTPRPRAPHTLDELMERLQRARARDYDESDDEAHPGLSGLSVAIEDRDTRGGAFAPYIAFSAVQVEATERHHLACMLLDLAQALAERFSNTPQKRRAHGR